MWKNKSSPSLMSPSLPLRNDGKHAFKLQGVACSIVPKPENRYDPLEGHSYNFNSERLLWQGAVHLEHVMCLMCLFYYLKLKHLNVFIKRSIDWKELKKKRQRFFLNFRENFTLLLMSESELVNVFVCPIFIYIFLNISEK